MEENDYLSGNRVALLNTLIDRTLEERISWEDTEREGVFQTSLPKYTFRVLTRPAPSGREVLVDLHNHMGQRIERMTQSQFEQAGEKGDRLVRMYEEARRQALNVDESIDEALKLLKSTPSGN